MMAYQAAIDDDVFDKLRFVNEIGTQCPPQRGEQVRNHSMEDAGAVIQGEKARTPEFRNSPSVPPISRVRASQLVGCG